MALFSLIVRQYHSHGRRPTKRTVTLERHLEETAGFINRMVCNRWRVLPLFFVMLTTPSHAQNIDLGEARHLEETEGESKVWIVGGPAGWLTERGELDGPVGLKMNIGYGYEVGDARLAWHLNVVEDLANGKSRFISLDLVSLERVYRVGGMQAYIRTALSVGTDVRVEGAEFGQKGFYNSENSATGFWFASRHWTRLTRIECVFPSSRCGMCPVWWRRSDGRALERDVRPWF